MAKTEDYKMTVDTKDWSTKFDLFKLALSPRRQAGIRMFMDLKAKRMKTWAKRYKVWKDRTGDAKRRLNGGVFFDSKSVTAFVAHGVYYGIYLEYDHQRKYAILEKARERYTKEVIDGVKEIIQRTAKGQKLEADLRK